MAEATGPRRLPVTRNARGVTPAVAKSLEMGMVVMFVALLTTVALGSVVPDYQRSADARVGDRVLATAATQIEQSVPPTAASVRSRSEIDLPARIGGQGYDLRVEGRQLVLDHPDDVVSDRTRLILPDRVDSIGGRWDSGVDSVVVVRGDADGLDVRLTDGGDG